MTMTSAKKDSTVLWWIGWIALTLISFFVSAWFWTGFLAKYAGTMDRPGMPILWVTAVFGTWLVLLVPLIIVMYNKVDRAYEDARISREAKQYEASKRELGVRSVRIEELDRLLPKALTDKLKRQKPIIKKGHLVTAVLKDGRRVPNVFIYDNRDVLGVYGQASLTFKISDIVDVIPVGESEPLTAFTADRWLRLDGVGQAPGA